MKNLTIILILLLFSQLSFSQDRIVLGVVTDSTGLPIPGTTISIEGTKKYTQTDFNGWYSINVKPDQFLIFTLVGMKPKRVSAAQDKINVVLQIDPVELKNMMGPVFTTQKKRSFLNAVKTLSAEEIKNNNDPKYNFKKDYDDKLLIFISDYTLKKADLEFQIKYKISYCSILNYSVEYAKVYNKLTFKYLKKKYKKTWQSEIKKDAIGLDAFLE
ncbi:CarboxypepD_reg-like domain-containing protein [Flavobacterium resistens]|uniref:CarboxypepD_reg-like domain-containing protein n=1 Tax=Flavobacterium resistens TaxID=443612 RepID=A0A521ANI6_9FLAO|nr:carboxypeptidase-like regulatory domain-containing protein [Flavobacterium resistens]MRX69807.1 hypothetical protein [Flavobacterium resistens]SMO36394.1 CarboxypepD_reg-like domain-containing protein [Flavobacterium resistens]